MSTAVSSVLFVRGADKVYFALLLTCLIYILCLSDPFPSYYGGSPEWISEVRGTNVDDISQSQYFDLSEAFKKDDAEKQREKANKDHINYLPQNTWIPPKVTGLDEERMEKAAPYVKAIMKPNDKQFEKMGCPRPFKHRYKGLRRRHNLASRFQEAPKQYFFALNLFQCVHILPRLLGSVVEAIRFLRPEDCVLSIVGGRSDDGTTEILTRFRHEMRALNVTYYFSTSDIDPLKQGNDRITELAKLRNLVLDPLVRRPEMYSPDASVIFLNDVALCLDDILEMVYQKAFQRADMVCSMDWVDHGDTFYDSWISRSITGDMFIEIPQSGSFDFKQNLFWNDPGTKKRFEEKLPFQVYSCWNGGAVFTARPLLKHNVTFRASYKDECYMGEPTLFCKDFWSAGFGRIAVVPSVNVGYNNEQALGAKEKFGYASDIVWTTEKVEHRDTRIRWKPTPPELVKCEPDWHHPSWVKWDEEQDRQRPFDWTHSGYFNAHSKDEEKEKHEAFKSEEEEDDDDDDDDDFFYYDGDGDGDDGDGEGEDEDEDGDDEGDDGDGKDENKEEDDKGGKDGGEEEEEEEDEDGEE